MAEYDIGPKERIQILLAEYTSLRNETVTRGNTIPTVVSVGVVSLSLVVASNICWIWKGALFVFLVAIVALLSRFIHRDILKAADRLRDLEVDINRRATEELLQWERKFAAGKRSLLADFWPKRWHYGPPK